MPNATTYFPKRLITGIITVAILSLLIWQYFHGGVPAHHILDKKDLPAISNWWGALLLPVLTWILIGRIEKRLQKQGATPPLTRKQKWLIGGLFLLGLAFGLTISISFIYNYKPFQDNFLYLILLISIVFPIFYSEFMLGYVIGSCYTFGAVLPTCFILIIALMAYIIYFLIKILKTKVI